MRRALTVCGNFLPMMQSFRSFSAFLFLSLHGIVYSQTDPCDSFKPFPDVHRRDSAYTLSSGESPINDREIVENWYGDPKYNLLDHAPGFFTCGTWYPIWKKESDGNRLSMCVQTHSDNCSNEFPIEMKSCDGFDIYYLSTAPVHRAAYCLEINPDAPPHYDVTPFVDIDLLNEEGVSKLLFRCEVTRSSEDLIYKTIWYVNGEPIYTFEPLEWVDDSFDYISNTTLTEDLLIQNGITKAGFNLQCAVRAQYETSSSSSESVLSENKFVGVKISHGVTEIMEGDTFQLWAYMTVPFGCGAFLASQGQICEFNVEIVSLDDPRECTSSLVAKGSCGMKPILSNGWQGRSSVSLVGKMTSVRETKTTTARLMLKTAKSSFHLSPLWIDYEIGHVDIRVVKNNTVAYNKYCESTNDPHERTFAYPRNVFIEEGSSNQDFLLNETGVYTMYKDESNSIEIQIQTKDCGYDGLFNYGPFCTCGVAVRAGKTVFEISHCNSLTWHIGYSACDDGGDVLTVRRRWSTYQISLPTGTILYAYMFTGQPSYMNVAIYPTVHDEEKNRGLCGKLSNTPTDDLIMRDGGLANTAEEFIESWRVHKDDNLFDPDVIKDDWPQYKPVFYYCKCTKDKEIDCSAKAGVEECTSDKNMQLVRDKGCTISKRKKRMALVGGHRSTMRAKRQVPSAQTWFNGWNESSATEYCDSQFNKSNIVQTVMNVPGVDLASMKRDCITDIKLSGTTSFTAMAVTSVRTFALHEALVDPVLKEADPSNPSAATLFDQITLQTCLGDCSGRGVCSEGLCQCDTGYGGGDCSVDLTKPPVLLDAGDGGHCDLAGGDCAVLSVIGEIFSGDKDNKCRMEKNMINKSGHSEKNTVETSAAISESISEVECTLPEAAADDIVLSYNISISHAGDIYSNEITVLVYDSSCVTVNHDTRVWTIQDGYCIYKGMCVGIGGYRQDDPCRRCDDVNGAPSWVKENDCPGGSPADGSDASNPTTHPVMVFFIITAAVVLQ